MFEYNKFAERLSSDFAFRYKPKMLLVNETDTFVSIMEGENFIGLSEIEFIPSSEGVYRFYTLEQ